MPSQLSSSDEEALSDLQVLALKITISWLTGFKLN